jgi:hypothetical protein
MNALASPSPASLRMLALAPALMLAGPAAEAAEPSGTLLGAPYIVNGGYTVSLDDGPSYYLSEGASIGNLPHMLSLAPDSGTLRLGSGVTWANEGLFYVGSHFGIQASVGSVDFEAGSTFYQTSPGFGDFPPADVRIGQGGTGTVRVLAGAAWFNQGQAGQVNFTVGKSGMLSIEGALYSDSSTSITGGTAYVQGAGAVWQVGGDSLDIEGVSSPGLLQITFGGHVHDIPSLHIGFSNSNSGLVTVGDTGDAPVRSLLEANVIELGVFGTAQGTLHVLGNGRVETPRMMLGRGGGSGLLDVDEGGEVLVGGFYASGPFANFVEFRPGSVIDVLDGGKVVIGSKTPPLLEPVFGVFDMFEEIAPGTVLVGRNGRLKGTGTIAGTLRIADGSLIVGHSTGTMTVDGDLLFEGDSALELEIAGPADFDRLIVAGTLTLGGTLALNFIDGFAPVAGDFFALDLFEAGALAGNFGGFTVAGLADGLALAVNLDGLALGQPLTFDVVPVPLPAAAWLFLSAVAALGTLGRRRSAATSGAV